MFEFTTFEKCARLIYLIRIYLSREFANAPKTLNMFSSDDYGGQQLKFLRRALYADKRLSEEDKQKVKNTFKKSHNIIHGNFKNYLISVKSEYHVIQINTDTTKYSSVKCLKQSGNQYGWTLEFIFSNEAKNDLYESIIIMETVLEKSSHFQKK